MFLILKKNEMEFKINCATTQPEVVETYTSMGWVIKEYINE